MLRHLCGYYLADKGTDLRTMQDCLGPRDPRYNPAERLQAISADAIQAIRPKTRADAGPSTALGHMWFKNYLFSSQGRFARVHWWGALLFWGLAFAVLGKLLAPIFPAQAQDCATRQTPGSTSTLCMTSWRVVIPVLCVLILVSLPPMIKTPA